MPQKNLSKETYIVNHKGFIPQFFDEVLGPRFFDKNVCQIQFIFKVWGEKPSQKSVKLPAPKTTWNPNDPCFDWKKLSFGGARDKQFPGIPWVYVYPQPTSVTLPGLKNPRWSGVVLIAHPLNIDGWNLKVTSFEKEIHLPNLHFGVPC